MKIFRPSRSVLAGRASGLKTAFALAALLFLAISCSHGVKFVDTADSTRVYGSYSTFTKNISVTLPTGESFSGKYFPLDPEDLGERQGSLFSRVDVSTYLGITGPPEGWQDWRAVLKGGRGGTLEVIFRYNGSRTTGYGIARTGKGGEYRVSLGESAEAPRTAPARRYKLPSTMPQPYD